MGENILDFLEGKGGYYLPYGGTRRALQGLQGLRFHGQDTGLEGLPFVST